MDSIGVRQVWLEHGGDATAAARTLTERGSKMTRQAVQYHVTRANTQSPLPAVAAVTLKDLDPADPAAQAIAKYVRACLDRAGISR